MQRKPDEEFVELLKAKGTGLPTKEFLAELTAIVKRGGILWGSNQLTGQFDHTDLIKSLSPETIFALCKLLLAQKTFEQVPLREVHIFSKLFGELLERSVAKNMGYMDYFHELNLGMLQQNTLLFKGSGESTTSECVGFFIDTYCATSSSPEMQGQMSQAKASLQEIFKKDLAKCVVELPDRLDQQRRAAVLEKRTSQLVNRSDSSHVLGRLKAEKPKPQAADKELVAKIRKQYKTKSSGDFFAKKNAKNQADRRSAPAKLTNDDGHKKKL